MSKKKPDTTPEVVGMSEQNKAYIRLHKNDTSLTELAKKVGDKTPSHSEVRAYLKELQQPKQQK